MGLNPITKITNIGRGDGITIPGCEECLTELQFRWNESGKPRDAKYANEIMEILCSNLRRQDKFHSPIASVSSDYTYGALSKGQ
jgi:hypothetical protein